MFRTMLKSKIHRATVTQADLHYVGSVTIDADLMDAADLLPGEQVAIVDVTNGARLVQAGDIVIIISYCTVTDAEARELEPKVVFVDADNRIAGTSHDPADALPGELDGLTGDAGDVSRGDLRTHLLRGDVVQ